MSDTILHMMITQSAVGAGLILLMAGLRRLLCNKVPYRLIYGLWVVVVLRMLIPLELPNPLQLGNHPSYPVVQAAYLSQWSEPSQPTSQINKAEQSDAAHAAVTGESTLYNTENALPQDAAMNPHGAARRVITLSQWLVMIWACGATLVTSYTMVVNRRYRKRIFGQAVMLPIQSPIPVFIADVPSPCLVGVLRPRIILNKVSAQSEHLSFVLTHELCHYRGFDHLWNLMRNVMLAVFWFHPLIWLAARLSREDCERACDERVMRELSDENSIEYARTLIALVSPRKALLGISASFMATNLPRMKKRVTLIVSRRRIQRWTCAFFAGIMLLISLSSFATGATVIREIKLPDEYQSAPLFYPTVSGLWVVLNGKLYSQSSDDRFTEITAISSAAQIAADKEAVYILSAEKREIASFDHQGTLQKAWSLPEGIKPLKIEISGDNLAIFSGDPANLEYGQVTAQGKVYLMNKLDGSLVEVKLGTVMDICDDKQGGLLALHMPMPGMTSSLISRVNTSNLSHSSITEVGAETTSIAADVGFIYILGHGTLQKYDERMKSSAEILVDGEHAKDSLNDMRACNGMLYAWGFSTNKLIAVDVSESRSDGKTVLTVINRHGYNESFESAKSEFQTRHPDVEIRDIDMDYDQCTTALLAGDKEIDLIFGSSGLIERFATAGALLPLDDQSTIMDALSRAKWLPFEEIFSYNGTLYGIPSYMTYNLWSVDASLAQQVGFSMPGYPFTWQDVYIAAQEAELGQPSKPILMYDYIGNPSVMYYYTMTQAQKQGALQYDTLGFREDMEAYRKMVEQGIIIMEGEEESPQVAPAIIKDFGDISDHTVPTPTVNGLEVAMMQSQGFCINPHSANLELAVEFLAEFAKPEHQYKGNYGNVDTMLLQDISKYNQEHYDDPDWGIARYTQKMEEIRQFSAGKWVSLSMKLHPMYILENTDALPQYLSGYITIDEFIRIIQSRADMMQYE